MKKFYILVVVMIFQFAHAQNLERIKSYIIEIGQVLDAYHAAAAEGGNDFSIRSCTRFGAH